MPQADKAFHIDDTILLMQAEQIRTAPIAPYAFSINWSSRSHSALVKNFNPPLLGYILAAVSAVFGFKEVVLHLFVGVFVWLMAYWTYRLAEDLTSRPLLASALVMTSPLLVPTLNCMPDIPHVALGIGGLYHFRRACLTSDSGSSSLWTAAFLLGLALWTKYPALYFVALAAVVAVWRRPAALVSLLLPVSMIGALAGMQWLVHGQTHFLVSQNIKLFRPVDMLGLNVLLVGSASLAAVSILAVGSKRRFAAWFVCIVSSGLVGWLWASNSTSPEIQGTFSTAGIWLVLLFAIGGAGLARAFAAVWAGRNFDERFLGLWVVGGVVFAAIYPEFPGGRRVLMVLPPLAILVVQSLSGKPPMPGSNRFGTNRRFPTTSVFAIAVILAQATLGAWVGTADFAYAGAYRQFVRTHRDRWNQRTVWTLGHDGWQWYSARAGWKSFEAERSRPEVGDLIVDPHYLVKQLVYFRELPGDRFAMFGVPDGGIEPRRYGVLTRIDRQESSATSVMRTYLPSRSINLHAFVFPFAFGGDEPLAVFDVYEFVEFP